MVKKIILSFLILGFAELGLLGSRLSVFTSSKDPHSRALLFENRLGQNLITNFSREIALTGSTHPWKFLPEASLPRKEQTLWQALSDSSLTSYFYSRTGTVHPWTSYDFSARIKGLAINDEAMGRFLRNLARVENRNPQNAELEIDGERATHFVPHAQGKILDEAQVNLDLRAALILGLKEVGLPLVTFEPEIKLEDLNNLGVQELLARGQTDFSGSSASRIQNIKVGAGRYQGLLFKPGEEFSFNRHLGTINAAHGFLPELVIKPEGTVPEFGGGLCQVSSTAFRAAFFAGLPITQRRNHSYAVRYYEWISDEAPKAPGLDATVYPGSQDLKFINDTPGVILIWTSVQGKRLYFDFYGTRDGREVVVDGPHPYDRKPDGAVRSKVARKISKDGRTQEVTFHSRYVSPQLYPKIYEYPKTPETPPLTPSNN